MCEVVCWGGLGWVGGVEGGWCGCHRGRKNYAGYPGGVYLNSRKKKAPPLPSTTKHTGKN